LDHDEPDCSELDDAEPNQGLYCEITISDLRSSEIPVLHSVEW